jgi:asparagine synthase (glutamine-hydrolysing)
VCGIAGIIGLIGAEQFDAVKRMNGAQRHRGPDAEGLWSSVSYGIQKPGVVFGHRRLAIIDLSPLGQQPMVDANTGCVICYNGEVYNFATLRRELVAEGHEFISQCDTEVILRAYARWGEACLSRLRGMFALAIWDPRQQGVLLARDRLGKKLLYYAEVEGANAERHFCFASELRALLAAQVVDKSIDPQGLSSYLWNGFVVGPNTLLRAIKLMPAGTSQWVSLDGRPKPAKRYWSLPHYASAQTDPGEARERTLYELEQSVKLRLVSDVPLGVFLSGGIDSSAVAALAMRGSASPITTFNVRFAEERFDESYYARAVARALGTDHHEVLLSEADFRGQHQAALASLDQPTFDGINTYFVSRAVREAGLTVALAGTGGDELFGGYTSFRDLPRASRVAAAARFLPSGPLRRAAEVVTRWKTGPFGEVRPQTRWGKVGDVLETQGDLFSVYQVSYGLFTRDFLQQLSEYGNLPGIDYGVPDARADELRRVARQGPDLYNISQLELSMFLGERLLRDTDSTSMAVSLEVRLPLIDHVFIEALSRVDLNQRYRPLRKKKLLREIAMPALDAALFERPKAGFELPLDLWCQRQLKPDIDALFSDDRACQRTGLAPQALNGLWRAFQARAPGLYWSRIWAAYTLLWWCTSYDVAL